MAYLVKPKNSSFWSAVWRDQKGKQIRRSTKEKNRKKAQKIADDYERIGLRARTARHVRQVIADLTKEITGEELIFPTVREYFASWLQVKKPETAGATYSFYRKSTSKFLGHLGEAADKPIDLITRKQITAFRNDLATTLSAKTVNHDLKALRMVFNAARKEGMIHENPAEDVETVRKTEGGEERRPFTLAEIRAVLAVADTEWQSMVKFGLFAGMRLSDVASLTWANLDLPRAEIRFKARKTGKTIILPMAGPLRSHVESLEVSDDPVGPIHPRAFAALQRSGKSGLVSNWFGDLLALAGLRPARTHEAKAAGAGRSAARVQSALSFHSLRHTAVSMLKDAGVPASVVMAIVGHDSTQMSEHYTHVGREALEQAAEKMPTL